MLCNWRVERRKHIFLNNLDKRYTEMITTLVGFRLYKKHNRIYENTIFYILQTILISGISTTCHSSTDYIDVLHSNSNCYS